MSLHAAVSRVDMRLLAIFMTVAESGGFAPAQITLNLGASAISRSITDLESRLGIRLCQRGRGGFRLTEKGRQCYGACQRLFAAVEQFRSEVGELRGELVGELTIAAIDNWVTDRRAPLTAALKALKLKGPGVTIDLMALAPDEIEHTVQEQRAPIGIGVFHRKRPGLVYEALYADPLELYCGATHPGFEDAKAGREPKGLPGFDYARRSYLSEESVSANTAKLPSTATGHQIESIAHLILTGLYIGYLPISYARQWVEKGEMTSISPDRYRAMTTIEIVTKRGRAPTLVERRFIELLRENAAPA